MRDFSSSFFISTTEKEVKTSQKQQRFFRERERQRNRETKREEKTSLVVVSRVIIIIIIRERERERERERDSYLVTHVWCFIVGARNQILCGVFDDEEDKKGEEKKESFGESAAQSFGG